MMNHDISIALWKPIESIPYEILDVNSICFCGNTLTVSLCDADNDYIFTFEELISNFGSYKYTATMHNLEFNEKIKHWYNECGIIGKAYPLLVLNSSDYIDVIKRQTYYAFPESYKNLKHYVFITFDAVIEVVSSIEPHCVIESNS